MYRCTCVEWYSYTPPPPVAQPTCQAILLTHVGFGWVGWGIGEVRALGYYLVKTCRASLAMHASVHTDLQTHQGDNRRK